MGILGVALGNEGIQGCLRKQ